MTDVPKENSSKQATIKDVAAEAEVAPSTVSLVINDKGYVSDDTRKRVEEAIERLEYIPQNAARRLPSQKTGNVGFVLREDHFSRSEPFYTKIFLGAEFEAHQQSLYVLLTTIPRDYGKGVDTPRFMSERNVDGLLVAGRVSSTFIEEAKAMNVPVVLIDFEHGDLPATMIDNRDGARQAVEHLLERGHRRIAFLGADIHHPSMAARLDGWRMSLSKADFDIDDELIIAEEEAEPRHRTGHRLCRKLLALEPRPTAVFCGNDALALGVLDYARQQGVTVPDELAIVGFDDVSGATNATPALTTVHVYKKQLGEVAMRHLSDLIDKPTSDWRKNHLRMKLNTELVIRASS